MREMRVVVDESTGEIVSQSEKKLEQNKNFVQFYRDQLHAVAKLGMTDPLALCVWLWIVERMGKDNALVCSMQPLREHFGKSRQTISKKVAFLRSHGFLGVAKTGTTNVYMVNADIVWSASASKRRAAEFRATVVIAESEQARAQNGGSTSSVRISAQRER